MLPDSHYDKDKADRAVAFIEHLCHTKGKWAGQPFLLLPWQEQIVRDLFGIVKENGKRQFLTAYIEIPKKNGKSELAAAIALYLLYADNEPSAEVYGRRASASSIIATPGSTRCCRRKPGPNTDSMCRAWSLTKSTPSRTASSMMS